MRNLVWMWVDVYYVTQNEDSSWGTPRVIVEQADSSMPPRIAIDTQGARHIAWVADDEEVYYGVLPPDVQR